LLIDGIDFRGTVEPMGVKLRCCRETLEGDLGGGGASTKRAPDRSGALFRSLQGLCCLDPGDVSGLKTFGAFDHVERYPIAFNKGFKPVAGDGGEVAKYVFAAFLLKKPKTLAVVKPFYRAVYHLVYLLLILLAVFVQDKP
jgi:hypothetical protein